MPEISTSAIERALVSDDLNKLNPDERAEYYNSTCESLGLNPLTQPFAYITLNGKLRLYARKDATDQLRRIYDVSVDELKHDFKESVGLYIVTAQGQNKAGRKDVSTGAVNIKGMSGEALANAIMKAETKSKRRLTLSICGLGMLDETELETIPEHQTQPIVEAPKAAVVPTIDHTPAVPTNEPRPGEKVAGGTTKIAEDAEVSEVKSRTKKLAKDAKIEEVILDKVEVVSGVADVDPKIDKTEPTVHAGIAGTVQKMDKTTKQSSERCRDLIGAGVQKDPLRAYILRVSGETDTKALNTAQWDEVLAPLEALLSEKGKGAVNVHIVDKPVPADEVF